MTREEAYQLLTKYLQNKNLLKHSFACEAGMKEVYRYLYEGKPSLSSVIETTWGITGLLHDIDYEIAQNENMLHKHGIYFFEKEPNNTIPEDIAHAIKAHAYEYTNVEPISDMDWGITCIDQLTGLIVAAALVHPDRKLASVTVETIQKRMKEKAFAKGAKREPILLCEEKLGIALPKFIELVLTGMQKIHKDLGL